MTEPLAMQEIRVSISYLYLLSFCPPDQVHAFKQAGLPLRSGLALHAGIPEEEFFAWSIPEACRRIVSFHQRLPEPDMTLVSRLSQAAVTAHESPEETYAYQMEIDRICSLPPRAASGKRLRDTRGCQLCAAPCRYGFFVLVSRPDFSRLEKMLHHNQKISDPGSALKASWSFATSHLWQSLGTNQGYISPFHLGNLSFCLLTLAMSRARFPFPEKELTAFQKWNRSLITGWPTNGNG